MNIKYLFCMSHPFSHLTIKNIHISSKIISKIENICKDFVSVFSSENLTDTTIHIYLRFSEHSIFCFFIGFVFFVGFSLFVCFLPFIPKTLLSALINMLKRIFTSHLFGNLSSFITLRIHFIIVINIVDKRAQQQQRKLNDAKNLRWNWKFSFFFSLVVARAEVLTKVLIVDFILARVNRNRVRLSSNHTNFSMICVCVFFVLKIFFNNFYVLLKIYASISYQQFNVECKK